MTYLTIILLCILSNVIKYMYMVSLIALSLEIFLYKMSYRAIICLLLDRTL